MLLGRERNDVADRTFRAEGVTNVFGDVRANDGITLEVRPGEVFGLLAPNGAGKSTFVKQVIGLLKPTSGSIGIGPYDLVEDRDAARQLCACLPQAQMPIDPFKAHQGPVDRRPRHRRGKATPGAAWTIAGWAAHAWVVGAEAVMGARVAPTAGRDRSDQSSTPRGLRRDD
jgi:energy-coupling factor transporter ATP-binding protein EcfA2